MKLLAIETSTMLGGLALMDSDGGLVAEIRLSVKTTHSEGLLKNIDHILSLAGWGMDDLDALAVAIGPGSFTGLRVGIGTVKGVAFALGTKVVGVPTLEAYAWSLPFSRLLVCPMLDARRKEVYAGVFDTSEGTSIKRLIPEAPIKPAALAEKLRELDPVVLMGQGALLYRAVFEETLGDRGIFAPPHLMAPSPSALAHAGMARALRDEFDDPAALVPHYIRKSEAELNWGQAGKS
jgi:tRNA threonylcarbamoyladenosine biosynthesis protein TsaB